MLGDDRRYPTEIVSPLNSPYRPPSSLTDNETTRHRTSYIVARVLLRLVAVFVTANLALGLFSNFAYAFSKAASDPAGMALVCAVIATLGYLSTSAYATLRLTNAEGPRLSIFGVLCETCIFTAMIIAILFSLAQLPSRYLGYPLSDVVPWYNDFYLLIPAVPIAAIASVEIARRLPRGRG